MIHSVGKINYCILFLGFKGALISRDVYFKTAIGRPVEMISNLELLRLFNLSSNGSLQLNHIHCVCRQKTWRSELFQKHSWFDGRRRIKFSITVIVKDCTWFSQSYCIMLILYKYCAVHLIAACNAKLLMDVNASCRCDHHPPMDLFPLYFYSNLQVATGIFLGSSTP